MGSMGIQVKTNTLVFCPECKQLFSYCDDGETMMCITHGCKFFHVKYQRVTIELKEA